MKIIFRILLFVFLLHSQTNLKAQQWINTYGPVTGKITDFTSRGSDVFASSWGGTIFSYKNQGNDWQQLYKGFISPYIKSVANYQGSIYCTAEALYKFDETDSIWKVTLTSPNKWFNSLHSDNNFLLAGTLYDGVYLLEGSNSSWINISNGLPSTGYNIYVNDFENFDSMFIVATEGRIYYSKNKGSNWVLASMPKHFSSTDKLVKVKNKLYVIANNVLASSVDSGQTWIKDTLGLNGRLFVYSMDYSDGLFCLSTNIGILYSFNYGDSFYIDTIPISNDSIPNGFTAIYIKGNTIWAGTGNGFLWKRSKYGTSSIIPDNTKTNEIYFNTWTKEITINSNIEVLDYNLISMNGKRLKAQINKINTHKYSINQNLPTGVYIIQLFSENKILTKKIFIH